MNRDIDYSIPIAIKPKRAKYMEATVVGIDSETCVGEPITIQIYSIQQPNLNACLFVGPKNVTTCIFDHFTRKCKSGYYRVYGHNLKFDLISFFWPIYRELAHVEGFAMTCGDWKIEGFYGTPSFVRATKGKITLEIVDSFLWFSTSLARAAETYFPDTPKYARPKGLGTQKFKKTDKYFIEYAMQDAIIACRLGHLIEQMHVDLQIKQQISLAGMSSAVFRTHFLKHEIIQVPKDYIRPAILAYHGGKNNVIPGAAPKWHNGVHSYDVSSAYPESMVYLPGFAHEDGYREFRGSNRVKSVPECGTYCVSGSVVDCNWPVLFHHDFKPIKGEQVSDIWVTGYELNEALSTGEINLTAPVVGIYYETKKAEDLPLKRFSEHFYKAKSEATEPVAKFRDKIILNSLYGKFIQTKETLVDDDDGNVVVGRVAAGLFQPLIAGSITGRARAKIHYLEHELEAIHTATDGMFTKKKINLKKLKIPQKGIGALQHEGSGTLALVRNKLYVLYSDEGEIKSYCFKGKRIKKYARHAFMGTLRDLEEFLANGKRKYFVDKPNSLKDSIKRDLVPNEFTKREYILRAGNLTVDGED